MVVELRGKWGGEKGGDEDAYPDGNPHEDRVTRIWVAGLKYAESDQHSCDYECERYAVDPVEQLTHPRPAEYAGFQSEDDREDEKHLHGRFVERNVVRRHVYKCRRGIGSFDVPNELSPRIDHPPEMPHGVVVFDSEAHTGFEPVLPENAEDKPDSDSKGQIAPGNELNPHLRAVLERLKERDRERRR